MKYPIQHKAIIWNFKSMLDLLLFIIKSYLLLCNKMQLILKKWYG